MASITSTVDIANWALDLMDEAEIQSLTENNKAARALNRQMDISRDTVLAESEWQFARRDKALSNDATAPDLPGFDYRSSLPGDLIHIVALWDGDPDSVLSRPIPEEQWKRLGAYLAHNLETYPHLEYTSNDTNFGGTVSNWGMKAAEAWAYHLAAATAKKITGSDAIADKLSQAYIRDKLPTAQLKEGHQGRVGENLRLRNRLARSPLIRSRITNRIPSIAETA